MKMIVLISGGMDSATALAWVLHQGGRVIALTFRYGSKHEQAESEAAARVTQALGVADHRFADLPTDLFKGSALTDGVLPLDRKLDEMQGVAPSYVPARNSILLSIAAGLADKEGCGAIVYAAHREDHVGYPDCRPEYFLAMAKALRLGTKNAVDLLAPFITWSKGRIVAEAAGLGVPLGLTHSCYAGARPACGRCDTCAVRIAAFQEAGYRDPLPYAAPVTWPPDTRPWPETGQEPLVGFHG